MRNIGAIGLQTAHPISKAKTPLYSISDTSISDQTG